MLILAFALAMPPQTVFVHACATVYSMTECTDTEVPRDMQQNAVIIARDTRVGLCLLHYERQYWFVRMWHPHAYRRCEAIR